MTKDKQIEEIYRILLDGCNGIDCYECEGNGKKDGCLHYHNANTIYNAGYRKDSDLVNEIFADVFKAIRKYYIEAEHAKSVTCELMLDDLKGDIAELKKKYTESEDK